MRLFTSQSHNNCALLHEDYFQTQQLTNKSKQDIIWCSMKVLHCTCTREYSWSYITYWLHEVVYELNNPREVTLCKLLRTKP